MIRHLFSYCIVAALALAQAVTPETSEGRPDLSGVWNGTTVNGPHLKSDDPLTANLPSRDGSLVNFERDGALIRRADPNKPLYKPEFWEKVQQLDQNGNEADPSYGCMLGGVPRMGPPDKIVQTSKEMIFLYVSPPARGWGDQYRVIPLDGRAHTPLADLDGNWKGESIGHWEGDTLTWQATVEDPDVLMKPWTMSPRVQKLNPDPKATLPETLPCVEHDLSHMVTKEHH